jgi:hypothetical protein
MATITIAGTAIVAMRRQCGDRRLGFHAKGAVRLAGPVRYRRL